MVCKNYVVFAISAVVFHSCFFEPSFIANFTLLCHTSKKSKYNERKKNFCDSSVTVFALIFQNHSIMQNDSLRNKGYNGLFSTHQQRAVTHTHSHTHTAPQGFCKIFLSLLFTFSILLLFFYHITF